MNLLVFILKVNFWCVIVGFPKNSLLLGMDSPKLIVWSGSHVQMSSLRLENGLDTSRPQVAKNAWPVANCKEHLPSAWPGTMFQLFDQIARGPFWNWQVGTLNKNWHQEFELSHTVLSQSAKIKFYTDHSLLVVRAHPAAFPLRSICNLQSSHVYCLSRWKTLHISTKYCKLRKGWCFTKPFHKNKMINLRLCFLLCMFVSFHPYNFLERQTIKPPCLPMLGVDSRHPLKLNAALVQFRRTTAWQFSMMTGQPRQDSA